MTVSDDNDLRKLQAIGRIVAQVLEGMGAAIQPGMTTAQLDDIGRRLLDDAGARSAPELAYDFPGATCISVNEEVAHGIPGARVIEPGDLSISTFPPRRTAFSPIPAPPSLSAGSMPAIERLCRDGRRALWAGIRQVRADAAHRVIGKAVGVFAKKHGYTLVRNLASHGIGRSLHEEPTEIATWPGHPDKRPMTEGLVFTVEPFLSLGAQWAQSAQDDDPWTLFSDPRAPTVQYEHTVVVTKQGPMVVTLPG